MTLTTHDYVRKSFSVEAIQVTEENMADVAEWCGGKVLTAARQPDNGVSSRPRMFIKVHVPNARSPRQTTAFASDWILKSGQSFKIYTEKAFRSTFQDPYTDQDLICLVEQKVRSAMAAQDVATYYSEGSDGTSVVASQTAKDIVKLLAA